MGGLLSQGCLQEKHGGHLQGVELFALAADWAAPNLYLEIYVPNIFVFNLKKKIKIFPQNRFHRDLATGSNQWVVDFFLAILAAALI